MHKKFRTLRTVAALLKVVAWVTLLFGLTVGSLMLGMGTVAGGSLQEVLSDLAAGISTEGFTGIVGGVGVMFMSFVYFLFLLAAAEVVDVALSIEQSSRETSELSHQIWTTFGPPKKAVDNQASKVEL